MSMSISLHFFQAACVSVSEARQNLRGAAFFLAAAAATLPNDACWHPETGVESEPLTRSLLCGCGDDESNPGFFPVHGTGWMDWDWVHVLGLGLGGRCEGGEGRVYVAHPHGLMWIGPNNACVGVSRGEGFVHRPSLSLSLPPPPDNNGGPGSYRVSSLLLSCPLTHLLT